jgi:siroheme synthase-like protein
LLIAPETARELNHPRLTRLCRCYEKGDLSGAFLAVAATDKREINRGIGLDARALGIPISVADRAAECTFKFPATVLTQKFSVGLISRQGDHASAKKTSKRVKEILEELCEP